MPNQSSSKTYKKHKIEEDYELGDVLGRGSFSVVKSAVSKQNGSQYALKMVNKKSVREINQVQNEINILSSTNHPNIIKLYDVYETEDTLCLVMELVRGGELYGDVVSSGPYDEAKVYHLFRQILDAVDYLHSKRIAHRDLKLENILVDEKWDIRLSDFGLSKMLEEGEFFMKARCGTPSYVAPEVIQGLDYTSMVDNWALGVILHLLLFCSYPFSGGALSEIYEAILEGQLKFDDKDVSVSSDAKDLISKLLVADPSKRYTISQIKQHPWILKFAHLSSQNPEDTSSMIATPPITILPNNPSPTSAATSPSNNVTTASSCPQNACCCSTEVTKDYVPIIQSSSHHSLATSNAGN